MTVTATATGLVSGTYAIDPVRSQVRLAAHHGFGLGPVSATVAIRAGLVVVAPRVEDCTVRATIDAASFTSDKARRDVAIRSKNFLDAQRFPDLVFVSERLSNADGRWYLHGSFTAHGHTAAAVVELDEGTADGAGCRFRAHGRIDRRDYKVGLAFLLGRYVSYELDIRGGLA